MDQIVADGVAPVHGAPSGGVGEMLIKQVICPVKIEKPVGIIDPIPRSFQMEKVGNHRTPSHKIGAGGMAPAQNPLRRWSVCCRGAYHAGLQLVP